MYQADARRMQDSTSHRLTTTRVYASIDFDFETVLVLIIVLKIESFNIAVFLDQFFVSFTFTSTSENITIPW